MLITLIGLGLIVFSLLYLGGRWYVRDITTYLAFSKAQAILLALLLSLLMVLIGVLYYHDGYDVGVDEGRNSYCFGE